MTKMIMLAKFIQAQRKKHGLTQEFLASELGISRPTYMQIELGERDLMIAEANTLAEIFGISLESFLRAESPSVLVNIEKQKRRLKSEQENIRISIPQERIEKFKQILSYILKKVGGKPNVGMAVLYKLLYFIDFDYYEKHEEQLMGLVYLKNHHGPTPLLFDTLVQDMVKNGDVEIIKSKFYKYPQIKYLVNPILEPDLSVLNGQELEHIEWELQRLSDMTASQLSEFSHKDVPWMSVGIGKPLEYESVFYRTVETSVRHYEYSDDAD